VVTAVAKFSVGTLALKGLFSILTVGAGLTVDGICKVIFNPVICPVKVVFDRMATITELGVLPGFKVP
jgi:hypothetical protein